MALIPQPKPASVGPSPFDRGFFDPILFDAGSGMTWIVDARPEKTGRKIPPPFEPLDFVAADFDVTAAPAATFLADFDPDVAEAY